MSQSPTLRGSSPHTRGAPTSSHWPVTLSRIIPAYAGSTAPLVAGPLAPMGSSPHTRGARGAEGVDRAVGRIIPAYAGSTGSTAVSGSATWDHPRIRGEHEEARYMTRYNPGSSPHTRGALKDEPIAHHHSRIIPAYAGSTRRERRGVDRKADHPRIRGEHHETDTSRPYFLGSSPHTRGAQSSPADQNSSCGIIPAYAGSTGILPLTSRRPMDHPRIRGEHLRTTGSSPKEDGSSPHTRGAPPWRGSGPFGIRIIPAYAGSTNTWRTTPPSTPDHPRIRGEHPRST